MIVNAVQQPRTIRTDHCPPVVGDFNKGTFRGSNEGRSLTLGTMTERWAREEATAKGFSSEGEKRVLVAGGECEAQWGVFMRKTWVWWHQMNADEKELEKRQKLTWQKREKVTSLRRSSPGNQRRFYTVTGGQGYAIVWHQFSLQSRTVNFVYSINVFL